MPKKFTFWLICSTVPLFSHILLASGNLSAQERALPAVVAPPVVPRPANQPQEPDYQALSEASLKRAVQRAQVTKQPVLLRFWNEGSPLCAQMTQHYYNDPQIKALVEQRFTLLPINGGYAVNLVKLFNVPGAPTEIVLGYDGREITRLVSLPTNMESYKAFLNTSLKKAANPQQAAPPAGAVAQPHHPVVQPTSPSIAQQNPSSVPTHPAPPAPDTAQPPSEMIEVRPDILNQQVGAAPPTGPPENFDAYALKGQDTVIWVRQQRSVPGVREFGAVHEGQVYLFISAANRDEFLRKRGRGYAPELQGCDPIIYLTQNQLVPGSSALAMTCNDFVFLFSSQEHQKQFTDNPGRFLEQYRQAIATRNAPR